MTACAPAPELLPAALELSPPTRFVAAHLPLPRGPEAPVRARRLVADRFAGRIAPAALRDTCLIVSELVTNAVVHGTGRISLHARLDRGVLRLEVVDEGTGEAPAIREQGEGDGGGWGLRIVDALSARWGAREGTTHVWAELVVA